jgi:molybdate transport system substrate-binding protein
VKSRVVSFLAVVLLMAACTDGGTGATPPTSTPPAPGASATGMPPTPAPVSLTILGAASLTGTLAAAKTAYESATPGVTLVISTDSSSALETKIEQGAPADVFLSADTTNPAKLVTAGLANGAPVVFAGNKLTIIVPTDNPARITSPKDLARTGVKIIAAGDTVPITKYAKMLVANLAKEMGYPTDFVATYNANVVSMEENVKAVVAKIELGQGDAAICYVTDAKASTKVKTIDVPPTANVPASYAGVVVKASANAAAAQAFLTWLAGPDGQAVLATFGFLPPGS